MNVDQLLATVTHAFNKYAVDGIDTYRAQNLDSLPDPSHICLKFTDLAAYDETKAAAAALGPVYTEQFNGKEIAWCKLRQPLKNLDTDIEWLEMVEPKLEKNSFNGVTSLGYRVQGLGNDVVKLESADKKVIFRYTGRHVHP